MQLASYTVFKTLLSNNRAFKGLLSEAREHYNIQHSIEVWVINTSREQAAILKILKNKGFPLLLLGLILHKQQQSLYIIYKLPWLHQTLGEDTLLLLT